MVDYSLTFAADTESGTRTLHFHERSIGGALEVAKKRAHGDWAELREGDKLICRLELVDDAGVWLVSASDGQEVPEKSD